MYVTPGPSLPVPVVDVVQDPLMVVRTGDHTVLRFLIWTFQTELLQSADVNLPNLFLRISLTVLVSDPIGPDLQNWLLIGHIGLVQGELEAHHVHPGEMVVKIFRGYRQFLDIFDSEEVDDVTDREIIEINDSSKVMPVHDIC